MWTTGSEPCGKSASFCPEHTGILLVQSEPLPCLCTSKDNRLRKRLDNGFWITHAEKQGCDSGKLMLVDIRQVTGTRWLLQTLLAHSVEKVTRSVNGNNRWKVEGRVTWTVGFCFCSWVYFYQTLEEKVQNMVFRFRKGICIFLFFLWDTNAKRCRKSHSLKNLDDLELLLSMTGISAVTGFSCSYPKLDAAASPAQTPDACF